jgi:hypothetical protein
VGGLSPSTLPSLCVASDHACSVLRICPILTVLGAVCCGPGYGFHRRKNMDEDQRECQRWAWVPLLRR